MKYKQLFMKRKRQKLFERYANANYKINRKLKARVVENGLLLPVRRNGNPVMWGDGGVFDEQGRYIEESGVENLFGGYYEYDEDFVRTSDEEVVYFGPFVKHWGHFICDQINRLWYILDDPSKYKIAYLGWNWWQQASDMDENFWELMQVLGIKREQVINVQEPTRFKKVIVPEAGMVAKQYYSEEYVRLIDRIVEGIGIDEEKECPKKVYFTRTELKNNDRDYGEKTIVEYLQDRGFEIVAPEKLTFKEQVFYLNRAEKFCTTAGSVSHNLVFAQRKTDVVILNKFELMNGYQMIIDHFTKAQISYVDAFKKIFVVLFGAGPFLICVNRNLRKCMGKGTKKYKLSAEDYIGYFKKYYQLYIKDPQNLKRIKEEKQRYVPEEGVVS